MSLDVQITQAPETPRWRLDIQRSPSTPIPPVGNDATAQFYIVVNDFTTNTSDDVEDFLTQIAGWILAGADRPVRLQLRKTVDSTSIAVDNDNY